MTDAEFAENDFTTKSSEIASSDKSEQFISKEKALKIIEPIADKYPDRWIDISSDVIPSGSRIAYNSFGEKSELEDIQYYDSPKYDSWLLVVGPDVTINGPQKLLHIFMNVQTGGLSEVWLEGRAIMDWDTSRNIFIESDTDKSLQFKSLPSASSSSLTQWAVILSGGVNRNLNGIRFWNDCQYVYNALTQELNYPSNHIFCLVSDGTDPATDRNIIGNIYDSSPLDFDGDGIADIAYSATKQNLSTVFNYLRTVVSPGDEVLIFVTDHGDYVNNTGYICLWNDQRLSPEELTLEVGKLGTSVNIDIVLGQCYSGSFITTLSEDNRTIMTACSAGEQSRGNISYDFFLRKWTDAIYEVNPNVSSNYSNGDGFLSSLEMFAYAKTNDSAADGNEHPQINNGPDAYSWGHDLSGNTFVPFISGADHVSSNVTSPFTLNNLPYSYSITWSHSSDIRTVSSTSRTVSVSGNITGYSQFISSGAEVVATFNDIGESIAVKKKGVTVWKPGSYINNNYIKGGSGVYYVGSYNWTGAYGFYWECDNPNWTITGQSDNNPYHYVYVDEEYTMDPVPLMVTFSDPLGGTIFILDYVH